MDSLSCVFFVSNQSSGLKRSEDVLECRLEILIAILICATHRKLPFRSIVVRRLITSGRPLTSEMLMRLV
jgi:hypothetical protein